MEIPFTTKPRPDTGLYNAKLGIWLFLASEVMLFGALFSSYIMLRISAPEGTWPEPGSMLKVMPGMINTIVLILSSVTVVMAWAALKVGNFKLYQKIQSVTVICALVFVVIKTFEYKDKFTHYEIIKTNGEVVDGHLVEKNDEFITVHVHHADHGDDAHAEHGDHDGHDHDHDHDGEEHKDHAEGEGHEEDGDSHGEHNHDHGDAGHGDAHGGGHGDGHVTVMMSDVKKMETYGPWHNTYLAIYFTLTGLHALHVVGGAFVIFMILGPLSGMWKTDPERYTNRVEVSGLFWHFVDLVWIFLFPILYLL